MNSSRPKPADQVTVNYDLSPFMPQNMSRSVSFQHDSIETLRDKLQIKSEALNLLAKQIELCNKEKSDYKRLIDTLYEKNLSLKKSLYFRENEVGEDTTYCTENLRSTSVTNMSHSATFNSALSITSKSKQIRHQQGSSLLKIPLFNKLSPDTSQTSLFSDAESEDYMKILKDLVKTLQKEKHELKQRYEDCEQQLADSKSDLRILREQILRQREGILNEGLISSYSAAGVTSPQVAVGIDCMAREDLIKEIEQLKAEKIESEIELKMLVCGKEEAEIERDTFKAKLFKLSEFVASAATLSERISSNLNEIDLIKDSPGPTVEFVDQNKRLLINKSLMSLNVDDLLSKNKFLNESNRNLHQELSDMKKSKANSGKFNLVLNDSTFANKKFVEYVIKKADTFLKENGSQYEMVQELKDLAESLFESLSDKLIASNHQRRVNKMLAARVQDLEKELAFYFGDRKKNETLQHGGIMLSETEVSLNESTEERLPLPLKPAIIDTRNEMRTNEKLINF